MARKKKTKKQSRKKQEYYEEDVAEKGILNQETLHTIAGIIIVVLAVFLFFAPTGNAGILGDITHDFLSFLFGIGYYLVPVTLLFITISFFKSDKSYFSLPGTLGGLLFLASGFSFVELMFDERTGGLVGYGIAFGLTKLVGETPAGLISAAGLIISLLVIFDEHISLKDLFGKLFKKKEPELYEDEYGDEDYDELPEEYSDDQTEEDEESEEVPEDEEAEEAPQESEESKGGLAGILSFGKGKKKVSHIQTGDYNAPPLSLLARDTGRPGAGDVKANANIIKRTLMNFGIEVEMDEVSIGPSITRYALKPAEGVKLSRIVSLQKELSLALAAHPLRIEAPIPGKSLVGIEIPNNIKTTVRLGSLLATPDFSGSTVPLSIALGRGISGAAHYANLAKMPHLLIAGTTGSGKSVTIHTLIASLLYRNSPEMIRFIMIDPKRVELTLYNNIPHLLTPVITDAKKAILSLKWAAKEMERRYDILEENRARDVSSYHENIVKPAMEKYEKKAGKGLTEEELEELESELPENMPYIVIVIDELADIMTSYPRELEASIVRLAQMSRAVGIHLVLSTQRPSTEVITGLIKANVPARIALQVPSQIDSRTIIDMPGAEKLLGSGDMLYLAADSSKPERIQSAFVTEEEVKRIVDHLKNAYEDEIPDEVNISDAGNANSLMSVDFESAEDSEDDDELYEDARELVINMKKASTSLIQRKLRVGYSRAARLLDMLEDRGVVGPQDGSRPREVLVGNESAVDEDDNYEGSEEDNNR